MGERGKNEEMKQRKTATLEPVAPDSAKPDSQEPIPQQHSSQQHSSQQHMGKPATLRKDVRLGREVQARIGQQLRAMYDDVVNQGVPQNIAELVRRLSEQD